MSVITVSCCSLNQWALDFEGNYRNIMDSILAARQRGARLRSGPELEICGYGCNDHFYEPDTVEHSWEIVGLLLVQRDILIDVGLPIMFKNCLYNCRLIFVNGKILGIRPKISLANDGNYREARWFTAWKRGVVCQFPLPDNIRNITGQLSAPMGDIVLRTTDGISIGFESCEELFTPLASNCYHALLGTDIILNGSASHHEFKKLHKKVDLISAVTKKNGGLYLYSNMMGCDGERVYYDGCPLIISNETFLAQGSQFSLDIVQTITATIDINNTRSYQSSHISRSNQAVDFINNDVIDVEFHLVCSEWNDFEKLSQPINITYFQSEEEVQLGPACWLWDYLRRSNSNGFFLPLSGGIDSCSVALIVYSMCILVCEAIKKGNESVLRDLRRVCCDESYTPETPQQLCARVLHTCYMGSKNSSIETRKRARDLAAALESYHIDCDIDQIVESFLSVFISVTNFMPKFKVYGGTMQENLALQNLQARIRMVMSYLFAQLVPLCRNTPGLSLLVLSCGNVDETLRGYLTKYDCSSADINPIGGVSKVDLQSFIDFMRKKLNLDLLEQFLSAQPTAELEPITSTYVQSDEADMGMTYKELSLFGTLRKIYHCGPLSMYRCLIQYWGSFLSPTQISSKVKSFFIYYSRNRHKTNVLPPSYHLSQYSPDDNRFDLRPILYNSSWSWQFRAIDEVVERHEKQRE